MSRLIDVDALISDLEYDIKWDQDSLDYEDLTDVNRKLIRNDKDCKQKAIDILKSTPTVDTVPVVHGHWIGKPLAGYSTVKCSACGSAFMENNGKWKYCPDCGAKMDEVMRFGM